LILGSSCAVLGLVGRLFSTHVMMDNRKHILVQIDKTLDMKKIAHLAPTAHLARQKADASV